MSDAAEIRQTAHAVLDRILDRVESNGDDGLMYVLKVLVGMRMANQDNTRYADYSAAMNILGDIGESAINGQGVIE